METKEAIALLKSDITVLKERGQDSVPIAGLQDYLSGLEKAAATSTELRNHALQSSLAQYDARVRSDLEMFKSVLDAGIEALKAVMLINGGAAVALLGALSYVVSKGGLEQLGLGVSISLAYFGGGVLSAALALGARYVTQAFFAVGHTKTGHGFNSLSILLTVVAYAAFGMGLFNAYHAFVNYFQR